MACVNKRYCRWPLSQDQFTSVADQPVVTSQQYVILDSETFPFRVQVIWIQKLIKEAEVTSNLIISQSIVFNYEECIWSTYDESHFLIFSSFQLFSCFIVSFFALFFFCQRSTFYFFKRRIFDRPQAMGFYNPPDLQKCPVYCVRRKQMSFSLNNSLPLGSLGALKCLHTFGGQRKRPSSTSQHAKDVTQSGSTFIIITFPINIPPGQSEIWFHSRPLQYPIILSHAKI